MSDADRADRIAELQGRMAVFLRQRKQAHEAGDREKETALQAQIAELDKQVEELRL
jgi:hypothetical protein